MSADISALIEQFRNGDEEAALSGLIALPEASLPALLDSFRTEPHGAIRALLVKALWERRDASVIPFLGEALRDGEEEVWQEALDGLVTLASPQALAVLQAAQTAPPNNEESARRFQLWLGEAIEQIQFELRRR